MADITAGMVKELRELTGLGMMECKKALTETNGDIKAAEDLLRVKSGAKASKAASRVTAEGIVGAYLASDGKLAAMVEVNCETDFVAKNEDFRAFAATIAELVATRNPADVAAIADLGIDGGTVEAKRQALVQKIGENISVRRYARFQSEARLIQYLHGGGRIGVTVEFAGGTDAVGKDVAMHIAASVAAIRPVCVSREQVPAELVERERQIYLAQAKESGKPDDIAKKMVEGRIQKFLAEVTLLGQPFVKNPDDTVEKHLKAHGATVKGFALYVVGEGIEKKSTDFAAEVAAMTKS
ncbi:MAG: elongation factor Ts [Betaproteobacteria bacterium]|nr:elongation factor Ts [Betaproteobacteria bacterium]